MLREKLKKELNNLSEEQLTKLADFFAVMKLQSGKNETSIDLKKQLSGKEKAEEFKQWVMQLPKNNNSSLTDEAFSRENIYD